MKLSLMAIIFFVCGLLTPFVFAQSPAPSSTQLVVPAVPLTQSVVVEAAPVGTVPVAEPAAPPKWAEDVILTIQKLPVVGPIVSKILVYLGIITSILTGFIAFLLTALNALSGIMNIAGLAKVADKLTLFKNGKIMYWLKYLSMFNAKKPQPTV